MVQLLSVAGHVWIVLLLVDVTSGWIRFRSPSSRRNYLEQTPLGRLQNCARKSENECGICGEGKGELLTSSIPFSRYVSINVSDDDIIDAEVAFRVNMQGYFEFRLCELGVDSFDSSRRCRQVAPLTVGKADKYYPGVRQRSAQVQLQLAPGTMCEKCVLQVRYKPGMYSSARNQVFLDCAMVSIYGNTSNVARKLARLKKLSATSTRTSTGTLTSTDTRSSTGTRTSTDTRTINTLLPGATLSDIEAGAVVSNSLGSINNAATGNRNVITQGGQIGAASTSDSLTGGTISTQVVNTTGLLFDMAQTGGNIYDKPILGNVQVGISGTASNFDRSDFNMDRQRSSGRSDFNMDGQRTGISGTNTPTRQFTQAELALNAVNVQPRWDSPTNTLVNVRVRPGGVAGAANVRVQPSGDAGAANVLVQPGGVAGAVNVRVRPAGDARAVNTVRVVDAQANVRVNDIDNLLSEPTDAASILQSQSRFRTNNLNGQRVESANIVPVVGLQSTLNTNNMNNQRTEFANIAPVVQNVGNVGTNIANQRTISETLINIRGQPNTVVGSLNTGQTWNSQSNLRLNNINVQPTDYTNIASSSQSQSNFRTDTINDLEREFMNTAPGMESQANFGVNNVNTQHTQSMNTASILQSNVGTDNVNVQRTDSVNIRPVVQPQGNFGINRVNGQRTDTVNIVPVGQPQGNNIGINRISGQRTDSVNLVGVGQPQGNLDINTIRGQRTDTVNILPVGQPQGNLGINSISGQRTDTVNIIPVGQPQGNNIGINRISGQRTDSVNLVGVGQPQGNLGINTISGQRTDTVNIVGVGQPQGNLGINSIGGQRTDSVNIVPVGQPQGNLGINSINGQRTDTVNLVRVGQPQGNLGINGISGQRTDSVNIVPVGQPQGNIGINSIGGQRTDIVNILPAVQPQGNLGINSISGQRTDSLNLVPAVQPQRDIGINSIGGQRTDTVNIVRAGQPQGNFGINTMNNRRIESANVNTIVQSQTNVDRNNVNSQPTDSVNIVPVVQPQGTFDINTANSQRTQSLNTASTLPSLGTFNTANVNLQPTQTANTGSVSQSQTTVYIDNANGQPTESVNIVPVVGSQSNFDINNVNTQQTESLNIVPVVQTQDMLNRIADLNTLTQNNLNRIADLNSQTITQDNLNRIAGLNSQTITQDSLNRIASLDSQTITQNNLNRIAGLNSQTITQDNLNRIAGLNSQTITQDNLNRIADLNSQTITQDNLNRIADLNSQTMNTASVSQSNFGTNNANSQPTDTITIVRVGQPHSTFDMNNLNSQRTSSVNSVSTLQDNVRVGGNSVISQPTDSAKTDSASQRQTTFYMDDVNGQPKQTADIGSVSQSQTTVYLDNANSQPTKTSSAGSVLQSQTNIGINNVNTQATEPLNIATVLQAQAIIENNQRIDSPNPASVSQSQSDILTNNVNRQTIQTVYTGSDPLSPPTTVYMDNVDTQPIGGSQIGIVTSGQAANSSWLSGSTVISNTGQSGATVTSNTGQSGSTVTSNTGQSGSTVISNTGQSASTVTGTGASVINDINRNTNLPINYEGADGAHTEYMLEAPQAGISNTRETNQINVQKQSGDVLTGGNIGLDGQFNDGTVNVTRITYTYNVTDAGGSSLPNAIRYDPNAPIDTAASSTDFTYVSTNDNNRAVISSGTMTNTNNIGVSPNDNNRAMVSSGTMSNVNSIGVSTDDNNRAMISSGTMNNANNIGIVSNNVPSGNVGVADTSLSGTLISSGIRNDANNIGVVSNNVPSGNIGVADASLSSTLISSGIRNDANNIGVVSNNVPSGNIGVADASLSSTFISSTGNDQAILGNATNIQYDASGSSISQSSSSNVDVQIGISNIATNNLDRINDTNTNVVVDTMNVGLDAGVTVSINTDVPNINDLPNVTPGWALKAGTSWDDVGNNISNIDGAVYTDIKSLNGTDASSQHNTNRSGTASWVTGHDAAFESEYLSNDTVSLSGVTYTANHTINDSSLRLNSSVDTTSVISEAWLIPSTTIDPFLNESYFDNYTLFQNEPISITSKPTAASSVIVVNATKTKEISSTKNYTLLTNATIPEFGSTTFNFLNESFIWNETTSTTMSPFEIDMLGMNETIVTKSKLSQNDVRRTDQSIVKVVDINIGTGQRTNSTNLIDSGVKQEIVNVPSLINVIPVTATNASIAANVTQGPSTPYVLSSDVTTEFLLNFPDTTTQVPRNVNAAVDMRVNLTEVTDVVNALGVHVADSTRNTQTDVRYDNTAGNMKANITIVGAGIAVQGNAIDTRNLSLAHTAFISGSFSGDTSINNIVSNTKPIDTAYVPIDTAYVPIVKVPETSTIEHSSFISYTDTNTAAVDTQPSIQTTGTSVREPTTATTLPDTTLQPEVTTIFTQGPYETTAENAPVRLQPVVPIVIPSTGINTETDSIRTSGTSFGITVTNRTNILINKTAVSPSVNERIQGRQDEVRANDINNVAYLPDWSSQVDSLGGVPINGGIGGSVFIPTSNDGSSSTNSLANGGTLSTSNKAISISFTNGMIPHAVDEIAFSTDRSVVGKDTSSTVLIKDDLNRISDLNSQTVDPSSVRTSFVQNEAAKDASFVYNGGSDFGATNVLVDEINVVKPVDLVINKGRSSTGFIFKTDGPSTMNTFNGNVITNMEKINNRRASATTDTFNSNAITNMEKINNRRASDISINGNVFVNKILTPIGTNRVERVRDVYTTPDVMPPINVVQVQNVERTVTYPKVDEYVERTATYPKVDGYELIDVASQNKAASNFDFFDPAELSSMHTRLANKIAVADDMRTINGKDMDLKTSQQYPSGIVWKGLGVSKSAATATLGQQYPNGIKQSSTFIVPEPAYIDKSQVSGRQSISQNGATSVKIVGKDTVEEAVDTAFLPSKTVTVQTQNPKQWTTSGASVTREGVSVNAGDLTKPNLSSSTLWDLNRKNREYVIANGNGRDWADANTNVVTKSVEGSTAATDGTNRNITLHLNISQYDLVPAADSTSNLNTNVFDYSESTLNTLASSSGKQEDDVNMQILRTLESIVLELRKNREQKLRGGTKVGMSEPVIQDASVAHGKTVLIHSDNSAQQNTGQNSTVTFRSTQSQMIDNTVNGNNLKTHDASLTSLTTGSNSESNPVFSVHSSLLKLTPEAREFAATRNAGSVQFDMKNLQGVTDERQFDTNKMTNTVFDNSINQVDASVAKSTASVSVHDRPIVMNKNAATVSVTNTINNAETNANILHQQVTGNDIRLETNKRQMNIINGNKVPNAGFDQMNNVVNPTDGSVIVTKQVDVTGGQSVIQVPQTATNTDDIYRSLTDTFASISTAGVNNAAASLQEVNKDTAGGQTISNTLHNVDIINPASSDTVQLDRSLNIEPTVVTTNNANAHQTIIQINGTDVHDPFAVIQSDVNNMHARTGSARNTAVNRNVLANTHTGISTGLKLDTNLSNNLNTGTRNIVAGSNVDRNMLKKSITSGTFVPPSTNKRSDNIARVTVTHDKAGTGAASSENYFVAAEENSQLTTNIPRKQNIPINTVQNVRSGNRVIANTVIDGPDTKQTNVVATDTTRAASGAEANANVANLVSLSEFVATNDGRTRADNPARNRVPVEAFADQEQLLVSIIQQIKDRMSKHNSSISILQANLPNLPIETRNTFSKLGINAPLGALGTSSSDATSRINAQSTVHTSQSTDPVYNKMPDRHRLPNSLSLSPEVPSAVCAEGERYVCQAVGKSATIPGMVWWCFRQCKAGNCPPSKCQCKCEVAVDPDVNVDMIMPKVIMGRPEERKQRVKKVITLTLNGSEETTVPVAGSIKSQAGHGMGNRRGINMPRPRVNTRAMITGTDVMGLSEARLSIIKCFGINAFRGTEGIDQWCTTMCRRKECPANICACQ